ncbi:MAG: amidohydrolase family protein [Planctomycetaceae bacterium]|nr:amidohydrolase family protein [Planctomycetaceae bacterium]
MEAAPEVRAYRARWIITLTGQPVENGVLVVSRGRIVRADSTSRVPCTDLGDVALIPGLVNAHTHLEFSSLGHPVPPGSSFPAWLRRVVEARGDSPAPKLAIAQGLRESIAAGVTLVGDIATTGWNPEDYAGSPLRGVIFQELIGLGAQRAAERVALAQSHVQRDADHGLPVGWSAGLSPHAPYTVRSELFARVCQMAAGYPSVPVAMHLAESREELELLQSGEGPFREFLSSLGVWPDDVFRDGRSIDEFLEPLSELDRAAIVHGNYLTHHQLAFLARHPHLTLVYCPRTHAAFGHPTHPWIDLHHLGGSVAVGTDSRASNPDLNLWAELQHIAAEYPEMRSPVILQMGTINGARVLGQGRDTGTLAVGRRADLAVVALDDPAFRDPWYDLFAPGNSIAGAMIGGEWVHASPALRRIGIEAAEQNRESGGSGSASVP